MKTIREEEHREYLHDAGCKSSSLGNKKNNKKSKQCDNLQERNIDKNQPKESNNQSLRSLGICSFVGDSMVNSTDKKVFSKKHGNVKVFDFSRARTADWRLKISVSM